jgi:hypothetical protein
VHGLGSTVDFGDLPTWLATLGALIAARYAYRAYQLERARDQEALAKERRAPAEMITAWVGPRKPRDRSGHFEGPRVTVRNASSTVIYDVTVSTAWNDGISESGFIPLIPPGQDDTSVMVNAEQLSIIHDEVTNAPEEGYDHLLQGVRVLLNFRDSAGVRWRRDPDGGLHLVP